jgi:TolA-binding protein
MYRSQKRKSKKHPVVSVTQAIRISFIAVALVWFVQTSSAQNGRLSMGGSLNVQIYASSGQLIDMPAQVTISSEESIAGIEQGVSNDGIARFSALPPGNYSVAVHAVGFKDAVVQVGLIGEGIQEAMVSLEPSTDPTSQAGAMGFVLAPKAQKDLNQGLAAMHSSKFAEAQQHLDAAYKLAPGNPDVSSAMAELCLATNDLSKAEQFLDHATSIDPDNLSALLDTGQLRILQKNPAGAQTALEHAVDVAPRDKFAHWLLGITYLDLGLYEKARIEAAEVVKINGSAATDGEFLLGEALAGLGRTTEAIAALKTFVKRVPHDGYTQSAQSLIAKLQSKPANQDTQQGVKQAVASAQ